MSAATLPLLGSLAGSARGAPATPRRLVTVCWDNGFSVNDLWPVGTETEFTWGKTLEPLTPLRKDVLFVGGLGLKVQLEADWKALGYGEPYHANHHAYPAIFTGVPLGMYWGDKDGPRNWAGGPSIDQFVATELAKTTPTRFPSLVIGTWTGQAGWKDSFAWSGGGAGGQVGKALPLTHESDPFKLFDRLFAGAATPKPELDRIREERRSVLDYVAGRLGAFEKGLAREDRDKVGLHVESVRQLERQLQGLAPGAGCQTPAMPPKFQATLARGGGGSDINDFPKVVQLQMDLVAAALRCDLTRVVNFSLMSCGGGALTFPWLGEEFLGPASQPGRKVKEYHDITHTQGKDADHTRRKIMADQWFVKQVAYLAQKLREAPEAGGSVLDQSAVLMTNTMGSDHNSDVVPFVVIGSLGGQLKTGRFLKVGPAASKAGFPRGTVGTAHNHLLVALANGMGVDGSKFGDPRYATELPGLRG